jgi:RNA polymerase primary sigma factor
MRAIDTYDFERAPRFATYARWWIKQSFIRALNSKSMTIRKPFYINEKLCQINKASNRLLKARERMPTLKEIASDTNTPLEIVERVVQSFRDPLSFDAPDREKSECIINPLQCEKIAPVLEQVISCNLSHTIDGALSSLPAREREIVKLRFGIGTTHDHTLEEIGQKFDLTRERIRQILNTVLIKLRHSKRMTKLKDFAEFN